MFGGFMLPYVRLRPFYLKSLALHHIRRPFAAVHQFVALPPGAHVHIKQGDGFGAVQHVRRPFAAVLTPSAISFSSTPPWPYTHFQRLFNNLFGTIGDYLFPSGSQGMLLVREGNKVRWRLPHILRHVRSSSGTQSGRCGTFGDHLLPYIRMLPFH